MYCALDRGHVIACHDSEDVVIKYCERINKYYNKKLEVGKLKKKVAKKVKDLDGLYLVRYKKTYVQAEYLVYMQITDDGRTEEYFEAQETLSKILKVRSPELDEKEIKNIKKTIGILNQLIEEDSKFTFDYDTLRNMEATYEGYLQQRGLI